MPRKQRHKVTEEECKKFNRIRDISKSTTTHTQKELLDMFKAIGWPKSTELVGCMCVGDNPPIINAPEGYKFPKEPVYIGRLSEAFRTYYKLKDEQRLKRKNKLKVVNDVMPPQNDKDSVEIAIELLKSIKDADGVEIYRIQKREVIWKDV